MLGVVGVNRAILVFWHVGVASESCCFFRMVAHLTVVLLCGGLEQGTELDACRRSCRLRKYLSCSVVQGGRLISPVSR